MQAQEIQLPASSARLRPLDYRMDACNTDVCPNAECGAPALACRAYDPLPSRHTFHLFREPLADLQQFVLPGVNARHTSDPAHALLIEWVMLDAMFAVHVEAVLRSPLQDRPVVPQPAANFFELRQVAPGQRLV